MPGKSLMRSVWSVLTHESLHTSGLADVAQGYASLHTGETKQIVQLMQMR